MTACRFAMLIALFATLLTQACGDYSNGGPMGPGYTPTPKTIVALSGVVIPHVPEFGLAIGDVNNKNEPGLHASGRREIN